MSPLMIDMLLHYYTTPTEYRDGDLSAPAVREAIEWFKDNGMLEVVMGKSATYGVTPKAVAWIEHVCSLPLPKQVWVMPEKV